jgi:hypothetical protein
VKLLGTKSLVSPCRHICCRNHIASEVVSFYHMGTKVHINYICQPGKWSPMFNHWLTCLHILCHINWKVLEMVDKMCNVFCLKHGRVCRNGVIKWIVWNHYHFLFLFGDKLLATARCFSWKTIFQKIEMDFLMYIWRHTSIVERLIFLCFFYICGLADIKKSNIGSIYQSIMSRLRKRHHRKQGFVFVKCTVYESLKDLISRLGKNSNEALKYEAKLKKHILHQ